MQALSLPIEADLRKLSVALTTPHPGECLTCFVARHVGVRLRLHPALGMPLARPAGPPGDCT